MAKQVKIISASNKVLWYADFIGAIYTVSTETPIAYWVKDDKGSVSWIYKQDCEVV